MDQAQAQSTGQSPGGSQRVTVEELFTVYGDEPVEVINGEIVPMSPNTREPMRAAGRLFASLFAFVQAGKLGEAYFETAYVLDADERTNWVHDARQPDISFVSQNRIDEHNQKYGQGGPWRLAPDLAVEVISPTDLFSEVVKKVNTYLAYGVKLVWLVDPQNQLVHVYTPETPNGVILREGDMLADDPVLAGWSLPVAGLFSA